MCDENPALKEFSYKNYRFAAGYTTLEALKECEAIEFRSTDIVILTVARTGTTVTQEIIWQVLNHETIEKDVKYPSMFERFCFIEFSSPEDHGDPSKVFTRQRLLECEPSKTRLIKTHLPYCFFRQNLEKAKPRVIIVLRNPKDTAVANYHFFNIIGFNDTWPEYFEKFVTGETLGGSYFDTYLEFWSLRDQQNVLILRYEDIIRQKHQQIRMIADFLKQDLTQEEIEIIAHNTAFKSMSENENVNIKLGEKGMFLRKGRSGTWKDELTVTQNEAMDRVIESKFGGTDLTFDFS